MNAKLSKGIAAGLFLALAAGFAGAEVVNVGNDELKDLLRQGVPLVDLRTPGEWQQTGVVEGSRMIMLYDERGRADADQWLAQVEKSADPGRPVVLICRTGNRTSRAAQLLAQKYPSRRIYNVREGITGWMRAGLPVVNVQQYTRQAGIQCSPAC